MMMVGGPDGVGVDVGAGVATGGVGDVGAAAGVLPEHAAAATKTINGKRARSTASPLVLRGGPMTAVAKEDRCRRALSELESGYSNSVAAS